MATWQPGNADLLDALAERLAEPIARRVVELLREQQAPNVDPWLDTTAAATYLGVNRDRLRKDAAAGAIPSQQDGPGCKRYFRCSDLDRWRENGGKPAHLRSVA